VLKKIELLGITDSLPVPAVIVQELMKALGLTYHIGLRNVGDLHIDMIGSAGRGDIPFPFTPPAEARVGLTPIHIMISKNFRVDRKTPDETIGFLLDNPIVIVSANDRTLPVTV
jgi:hypothetical protein